ncbi:MAG: XRE family transcriptional regulator [Candidatus Electrothrix sp. MAN1_4]|nr:XRE family transcriptional regulator [Candidatus Electrothrix sp. MAN1_4]
MKKEKQRKLEKAGWKVGDTADFLELTKEEAALIDMKISLSKTFHNLRKKAKLTQVQVAGILHTSQSRIAKMEVGDPSVSMELLVKGMIKLGASKKTVGQALVSS